MYGFPSQIIHNGRVLRHAGRGVEVGARRYVDLAMGRSVDLWMAEITYLTPWRVELQVLGNPSRRRIAVPRRLIDQVGDACLGARFLAGPVCWGGDHAWAAMVWAWPRVRSQVPRQAVA